MMGFDPEVEVVLSFEKSQGDESDEFELDAPAFVTAFIKDSFILIPEVVVLLTPPMTV
jgi:hypothetical protein